MTRTTTWHTTMEIDADVEVDCAVKAAIHGRYVPARIRMDDGGDPPECPEVEILSVITEHGDEVLHLLRPHEVDRLESEAMSTACDDWDSDAYDAAELRCDR